MAGSCEDVFERCGEESILPVRAFSTAAMDEEDVPGHTHSLKARRTCFRNSIATHAILGRNVLSARTCQAITCEWRIEACVPIYTLSAPRKPLAA